MLLGTYSGKFASGHRVSIPSSFRKELGGSYILARWYESCLVLVGTEFWNALYKRLTGSTELIVNPVRDTERFILSGAFEVIPDDQGRVVIPEMLITYAGLSDEIVIIGLGEKAEIWDKKAWEVKEKQVIDKAPEYIEELSKK